MPEPTNIPLLTIIIPVYNRESLVERTLSSVAAQTLRQLQVILVDNNSTDNSLQVLQQWQRANSRPDFQIEVLTEKQPGAAAARNCGLAAASSEFVMFFDSDDTMTPDHCARALTALTSPAKPDLVGWDINMHLLNGKTARKPFYATDPLWHCVMHGSMGTQRWAARTDLVRRAGKWNPDIMGWNDIELGTRMLLLSPRIEKLNGTPTVNVFSQADSITGTCFSSTPRKWETSLDAIEASMPDRRLRRYPNLRRALLAGNYARENAPDDSRRLLSAALAREDSRFHRILLRAACRYVAFGGRAAARILRPLY